MATETLYAGPGKVYFNSVGFYPEGENGELAITVEQEKLSVAAGMFGRLRDQQGDAVCRIKMRPFDRWGLLPTLYPAYVGATQGVTSGALLIGTLLFGAAGSPAPLVVWAPDGRLYSFVRGGISKPPNLHLGVGKPLFDDMEFTCIGDASKLLGAADFLYTITESAGADPGGAFAVTDFIRESWMGAWGSVTGWTAIEAEEEWVIQCEIKYQFYKVQKLTRMAKLISVNFMAKTRPIGPTHTQIDSAIGANNGRILGSSFAATGNDLVLTSASGKTITIKNSDVVGAGYEFGGTKLGTGEVGFVNAMTFTAGAPQPLIVFSA